MENVKSIMEPVYNLNPIFILGARQRSGTNFLRNLLLLHPAIGNGCVVWEDSLLIYSDLLKQYAQKTHNLWPPHWEVQEKVGSYEVLCEHIGSGLVSFLNLCVAKKGFGYIGSHIKNPDDVKMLVTKTPTVKCIGNFHKLFPNAHLIVVVRDGRSTVESGVRSFGWHYESAIKSWDEEIKTIIQFKEKVHREGKDRKLLIVRFEDLFSNSKTELEKIFSFLGVSAKEYDFHAADNLPISGSSDVAKKEEKKLHWAFKKKEKNFNPTKRFQSWSRMKHERFNWLAGESLASFGYDRKNYDTNRYLWFCWNKFNDKYWEVRKHLWWLKKLIH